MLLFLWPHRPHTVVSCLSAPTALEGNWFVLTPTDAKCRPLSHVSRVCLPEHWASYVDRFLLDRPAESRWLFSLDGRKPSTGLYDSVWRAFVGPFGPAELQPYDCRRFGATAFFVAGAHPQRIMLLGGWATWGSVQKHYLEPSLPLTDCIRRYYS